MQDILWTQVVRILVMRVLSLRGLEPQLKVITRVLYDAALAVLQDKPQESDEIKVMQHFSPACRAARHGTVRKLAAATILREISDTDINHCRERAYSTLAGFTFILIAIPAVLAILSETFLPQLLDIWNNTGFSVFMLGANEIFIFSPLLLITLFCVLGSILVYNLTIFRRIIQRAKKRSFLDHNNWIQIKNSRKRLIFTKKFDRKVVNPITIVLDIMDTLMYSVVKVMDNIIYFHVYISKTRKKLLDKKHRQEDITWLLMNKNIKIQSSDELHQSQVNSSFMLQYRRSSMNKSLFNLKKYDSSVMNIPHEIQLLRPDDKLLKRTTRQSQLSLPIQSWEERRNTYLFNADQTLNMNNNSNNNAEEIKPIVYFDNKKDKSPSVIVDTNKIVVLSYKYLHAPTVDIDLAMRRFIYRYTVGEISYKNQQQMQFLPTLWSDLTNYQDYEGIIISTEIIEMLPWFWSIYHPGHHVVSDEEQNEIVMKILLWCRVNAVDTTEATPNQNLLRTNRLSDHRTNDEGTTKRRVSLQLQTFVDTLFSNHRQPDNRQQNQKKKNNKTSIINNISNKSIQKISTYPPMRASNNNILSRSYSKYSALPIPPWLPRPHHTGDDDDPRPVIPLRRALSEGGGQNRQNRENRRNKTTSFRVPDNRELVHQNSSSFFIPSSSFLTTSSVISMVDEKSMSDSNVFYISSPSESTSTLAIPSTAASFLSNDLSQSTGSKSSNDISTITNSMNRKNHHMAYRMRNSLPSQSVAIPVVEGGEKVELEIEEDDISDGEQAWTLSSMPEYLVANKTISGDILTVMNYDSTGISPPVDVIDDSHSYVIDGNNKESFGFNPAPTPSTSQAFPPSHRFLSPSLSSSTMSFFPSYTDISLHNIIPSLRHLDPSPSIKSNNSTYPPDITDTTLHSHNTIDSNRESDLIQQLNHPISSRHLLMISQKSTPAGPREGSYPNSPRLTPRSNPQSPRSPLLRTIDDVMMCNNMMGNYLMGNNMIGGDGMNIDEGNQLESRQTSFYSNSQGGYSSITNEKSSTSSTSSSQDSQKSGSDNDNDSPNDNDRYGIVDNIDRIGFFESDHQKNNDSNLLRLDSHHKYDDSISSSRNKSAMERSKSFVTWQNATSPLMVRYIKLSSVLIVLLYRY